MTGELLRFPSREQRERRRDAVAQALDAIISGDIDAPAVLDVLEGRVLCNPGERQLVDELRDLAIRVKRACGTLDVKRPEQRARAPRPMISDPEAADLFVKLMCFVGGFFLADALEGFKEACARRRANKVRQHPVGKLGVSRDEKARETGRNEQEDEQPAVKAPARVAFVRCGRNPIFLHVGIDRVFLHVGLLPRERVEDGADRVRYSVPIGGGLEVTIWRRYDGGASGHGSSQKNGKPNSRASGPEEGGSH